MYDPRPCSWLILPRLPKDKGKRESTRWQHVPSAWFLRPHPWETPPRARYLTCWFRKLFDMQGLLDMIVGSLSRNNDIVNMAFAQSSAGNADKLRIRLQVGNCSAPQIAHPRAQSANELQNHAFQRSAIRHATLNSLGHKLRQAILARTLALHHILNAFRGRACIVAALKIALARTQRHRRQRTHPAIRLERTSLVQNRLARTLVHAGKQRPDHD